MEVLKTESKRRQRERGRLAKRVKAKKESGSFCCEDGGWYSEQGTKAEK